MSNKLFEIADEAAKGGFFLFFGNASATFISALGAIAIARLLGPANYGLYSLSLAIPFLLAALADFGVSPALTRYSAKLRVEGKRSQLASMLKAGFSMKFLTGFSFMALALIFSRGLAASLLNRPEAGGYLALASALILFQALTSMASSSLVGLDEMGSVSLIMVVQSIVRALASPLLILIGLSVLGALLGHALSSAIAAIVGLTILLNHYLRFKEGPREGGNLKGAVSTMVQYGFPAYLAVLLTMLLTQYQNLVLAHFVSNFEIGNFNASINFSALINLIAFPITTVLFPAFSKLNPNRDDGALKRMFALTIKYVSLLLVPSSLLIAILSKDLIYLIYGGSYALAPLYLSIYVGTFLVMGLGYLVLQNLFNGIGETRETMKMAMLTVFAFLPAAPLAAKALRVPGLIIALIASTTVGLIYGLVKARKKYGLKADYGGLTKICLAAALASPSAFAITLPLRLPASINVAIGGLSYLLAYTTVVALIEAIDAQDLMNLSQLLQNRRMISSIAKPILSYEARLLNLKRRLSNKRRPDSTIKNPA